MATVSFYSVRGMSMRNGVHPIFTEDPPSLYTVQAKATDNLAMTITVPLFPSWVEANVCKVDDRWYWITDIAENTLKNASLTVSLTYMPVTSLLSVGSTVHGGFIRYPEKRADNHIRCDHLTSSMGNAEHERFATMSWVGRRPDMDQYFIDHSEVEHHMFWVEITTSARFFGAVVSDYDPLLTPILKIRGIDMADDTQVSEHLIVNRSRMTRYGFFVDYVDGTTYRNTFMKVFDSSAIHLQDYDDAQWTGDVYYPRLCDVLSDIDDTLGIPTDTIMDISISSYCPYDFGISNTGVPYLKQNTVVSQPVIFGDGLIPYIVRRNSVPVVQDPNGISRSATVMFCMYEIGSEGLRRFRDDTWTLHTMRFSESEIAGGRLYAVQANGSQVAEIPLDYASRTSDGEYILSYRCREIADPSGLYCQIALEDGNIITVPEGKLPYVGDSWAQYRVREMATDRQATRDAKDQALMSFGASLAGSVLSGGLSLGSVVGSGLGTLIQMDAADRNLALRQRTVRASPGNGVDTGYGLKYIKDSVSFGAGLVLMMPWGSSVTAYDEYIQHHGYPDERYLSYTLKEGTQYIQMLLETYTADNGENGENGIYFDALASVLSNGVRIVVI